MPSQKKKYFPQHDWDGRKTRTLKRAEIKWKWEGKEKNNREFEKNQNKVEMGGKRKKKNTNGYLKQSFAMSTFVKPWWTWASILMATRARQTDRR